MGNIPLIIQHENKQPNLKMNKGIEEKFFPKEDVQMALSTWEDVQHHQSLAKCKLNYSPIPLHTHWDCKKQRTSGSQDVWRFLKHFLVKFLR